MVRTYACGLMMIAGLATGCGKDNGGRGERPEVKIEKTVVSSDPGATAEGKQFMLTGEPAGAKGVIEVRKQAKDGDDIVVKGRVGGSTKPFTEGRASFLIVDPSLPPTMECHMPWDYCEVPKAELAAARAVVKFVDGQGKTLQTGAKELFGIKELTPVVVKGKASRDEKGNLSVLASGIFVLKDKE